MAKEKKKNRPFLLKKISIKGVAGKPEFTGEDDKESVLVMRIIGIATGVKTVVTTFGESTGLRGSFRAYDNSGKEYQAPIAWLPDVVIDTVTAAMSMTGNELPAVQFGFDIYAVKDDKSNIGYVYNCVPIVDSGPDQLDEIAQTIPAMITV